MGDGKVLARTMPAGTPTWVRDATLNDSDKSFTVGANRRWILKSVYAEIATTAAVGNRTLGIVITNGTNTLLAGTRSGNIAASVNGNIFANDSTTLGTGTQAFLLLSASAASVSMYNAMLPTGGLSLPAGYVVRVYDTAAVDAAADDMTVILHYEELDV